MPHRSQVSRRPGVRNAVVGTHSALALAGLLTGLIAAPTGTPAVTAIPATSWPTTTRAAAQTDAPATPGPSGSPSPADPTHTPTSTGTPTGTDSPATTPAPSASGSPQAAPSPTVTSTASSAPGSAPAVVIRRSDAPFRHGDVRGTSAAGVAGQAADGDGTASIRRAWTSSLPTGTGLKLVAAGLLGLAIAIGGLAAMAIRRVGRP